MRALGFASNTTRSNVFILKAASCWFDALVAVGWIHNNIILNFFFMLYLLTVVGSLCLYYVSLSLFLFIFFSFDEMVFTVCFFSPIHPPISLHSGNMARKSLIFSYFLVYFLCDSFFSFTKCTSTEMHWQTERCKLLFRVRCLLARFVLCIWLFMIVLCVCSTVHTAHTQSVRTKRIIRVKW